MRAKRLLLALLRPPRVVVVLAPFAIVAMMAWAFMLEGKQHPISNAAYALSFYLLVVICVWAATGSPVKRVRCIACRSQLVDRTMNDKRFRQNAVIRAGIAIDALWASVNALLSIVEASVWFATLACCYFLFGVTRLLIYRQMRREEVSESGAGHIGRESRRMMKAVGAVIIASAIVLSGIVTLVLRDEAVINYSDISAISLATFTFYTLISAILACLRTRHGISLIEAANARINLSIALVTLFTLEVALLTTFGEVEDGGSSSALMMITGTCIACALCALGAATIHRANQSKIDGNA